MLAQLKILNFLTTLKSPRLPAIFSITCLLAACATAPSQMPVPIPQDGTVPFDLAQPWNSSLDAGFEPGTVHLAWTPTALVITADLTDVDVSTKATADNQAMWELGDAFEMFIQVEGRTDYVELHIVPTNHKLHLEMPGIRGKPTPDAPSYTFDQMLVSPVGFTSEVKRTPTGWHVSARVPANVLGIRNFESGQRLRISFSRYDVTGSSDAILSTTATHQIVDFHRPNDWPQVELAE